MEPRPRLSRKDFIKLCATGFVAVAIKACGAPVASPGPTETSANAPGVTIATNTPEPTAVPSPDSPEASSTPNPTDSHPGQNTGTGSAEVNIPTEFNVVPGVSYLEVLDGIENAPLRSGDPEKIANTQAFQDMLLANGYLGIIAAEEDGDGNYISTTLIFQDGNRVAVVNIPEGLTDGSKTTKNHAYGGVINYIDPESHEKTFKALPVVALSNYRDSVVAIGVVVKDSSIVPVLNSETPKAGAFRIVLVDLVDNKILGDMPGLKEGDKPVSVYWLDQGPATRYDGGFRTFAIRDGVRIQDYYKEKLQPANTETASEEPKPTATQDQSPSQPPTSESQPTVQPTPDTQPTAQATQVVEPPAQQPVPPETGVSCDGRAEAFCLRTVEGRAFGTRTYTDSNKTVSFLPARPLGEFVHHTFPAEDIKAGTVQVLARVIYIDYGTGVATVDVNSSDYPLGTHTIVLSGASIEMWGRYSYPNPNGYGYVSDGYRPDAAISDIAGESSQNNNSGDFIILYLDPAQFGVDVYFFDPNGNRGKASELLKNSPPWNIKFAIIFQ